MSGELELRPEGEVAPVLDGEQLAVEPVRPARQTIAGRVVRRPVHIVTTLRQSERAKVLAAQAARPVWLIWSGHVSWARRAALAATHGAYREQVRVTRAAGDREQLVAALDQLQRAKDARSQRLRNLPAAVIGAVKAATVLLVLLGGLTVALGIGVQLTPGGWTWGDWWGALGALVTLAGTVLYAAAVAAVWAAVPVDLVASFREGRRVVAEAPRWLRTAGDGEDVTIDETTIARALDALRIPQISQYLKGGGLLQFLTPARIDGRGTHAVIRLPAGVTAEKVARRRADLATGLHRLSKEVWPTTGAEAGILDLWVADKGALAEGAGAYPLLTEGVVDVFKGVPFGKNLRGAPVTAPLMERNTITGGMPGQGKSSAARVLMAGAALDPTAELRIWVPDANFDFEVFRPRCSRYVMGAEDERIAEILDDLRELHREVQVRGELLVRFEIPAVTREYACRGVGLHPIVGLLEEAHVAITHAKYGAEISKLLVDIVRLGRKRGIHLIVSTQAPTKDSMPRDVTRNCSNGIAFAVGDHVANDALLGQGAYAGGHRATELIPGTDRGTAVVKGFSGQRSEIVQVYFLDVERGNDQVTPIIDRSLDLIARGGGGVPGTGPRAEVVERDLLEDLDAVLGVEPRPVADVPALLAAHAPGWGPYRDLTGKALRQRLADAYGVKVPSTGNRYPLDPATVRAALARRATADLDGQ